MRFNPFWCFFSACLGSSVTSTIREEIGVGEDTFVATTLARYHIAKGLPYLVDSIAELETSDNKKLEFTGTLTGYGPDCEGCSGIVGCSPYQNVQAGNIYYEDEIYGKIRILAADPSIPCGSIIKISNYNFIKGDFYGIVLDRGSAIQGLTMDLLYESEKDTLKIGRTYNINFKIERWGF